MNRVISKIERISYVLSKEEVEKAIRRFVREESVGGGCAKGTVTEFTIENGVVVGAKVYTDFHSSDAIRSIPVGASDEDKS